MANFKVTLANNEILHLKRSWWEFWIIDGFKNTSFKTERNKRIKIGNHWIIKIEQE